MFHSLVPCLTRLEAFLLKKCLDQPCPTLGPSMKIFRPFRFVNYYYYECISLESFDWNYVINHTSQLICLGIFKNILSIRSLCPHPYEAAPPSKPHSCVPRSHQNKMLELLPVLSFENYSALALIQFGRPGLSPQSFNSVGHYVLVSRWE